MNSTFEMNGKNYRTDAATLAMLREMVETFNATGDVDGVSVVMRMGMAYGRIVEIA